MSDQVNVSPFASLREDAPAYWGLGILWIMHADASSTAGRWSVVEELCGKGTGAPPHIHEWSDEIFYVLDGKVRFLLESQIMEVGPGAVVSIPRQTVHGFRVDSESARILNMYVPASWEAAIPLTCTPATARTLPPAGLPSRQNEDMTALMAKYGMRPVAGPDPLRP